MIPKAPIPKAPKPTTHRGYSLETTERVKEVCLSVATHLNDVLQEDLFLVGGLVPTLLDCGPGRHVGTRDVDMGFNVGIREAEHYTALTERLRQAGFAPEDPKLKWRWVLETENARVLLEFLIASDQALGRPKFERISDDLDALAIYGLDLAFRDWESVELSGLTTKKERATRTVRVCGPGAFVLLKALALNNRGENKDAYDLHYVVQHWVYGKPDIARRIEGLLVEPSAQAALTYLRRDFASLEHVGPRRAAAFLDRDGDETHCADVWAQVQDLLDLLS